MKPILEVCCTSITSALIAQEAGAHRIELCDNLYEGGTTPSIGTVELVHERLSIDVNVLIRPRGGDFLYSEDEMKIIKRDIMKCKELGVNGIVIGFLTPDGEIDVQQTQQITDYARPLSITFHRAFDMCRDPHKALNQLKEIGVDRLLTSGQKNTAPEGAELITDLIDMAGASIIVMPGAGLTPENIKSFHNRVKAKEYHASLREKTESHMRYRKNGVSMGGLPDIPEYNVMQASPEKIRTFLNELE